MQRKRDSKGRFVRIDPKKSNFWVAPKIAFVLILLYMLITF